MFTFTTYTHGKWTRSVYSAFHTNVCRPSWNVETARPQCSIPLTARGRRQQTSRSTNQLGGLCHPNSHTIPWVSLFSAKKCHSLYDLPNIYLMIILFFYNFSSTMKLSLKLLNYFFKICTKQSSYRQEKFNLIFGVDKIV